MNCPKCDQPVEDGAAFCGNCGQALGQSTPAPASSTSARVPAYALATPLQHKGDTQALMAVLFGITGVIGALFMALFGLVLGIAGIIMGTMSRSSSKRRLSTAGIIFSSISLVLGLAVWAYTIKKAPDESIAAAGPTSTIYVSELSTPCYSLGFVDKLTVNKSADSCSLNAYNGESLNLSSNVYKIYAHNAEITSANDFTNLAKQAIEKDVKENLGGFKITSQQAGTFAGSPAYLVKVLDNANKVALIEAAVYHQTKQGSNVFILVHANQGDEVNLDILESQWQWK